MKRQAIHRLMCTPYRDSIDETIYIDARDHPLGEVVTKETPLRLLRTLLLIFNAKDDTRSSCQRLYGYKLVVGFTLERRY